MSNVFTPKIKSRWCPVSARTGGSLEPDNASGISLGGNMSWKTEKRKRGWTLETIILFVGIALGLLIVGAALLMDMQDHKPAPAAVEQVKT